MFNSFNPALALCFQPGGRMRDRGETVSTVCLRREKASQWLNFDALAFHRAEATVLSRTDTDLGASRISVTRAFLLTADKLLIRFGVLLPPLSSPAEGWVVMNEVMVPTAPIPFLSPINPEYQMGL